MPTYDFRCDCGNRFERFLGSLRDANPACPGCAGMTFRLPSRIALLGQIRAPQGDARAPKSYEGTHRGNSEFIAHWQRKLEARRVFEDTHPEHHVRRDAIAAHEGAFQRAPLTYRELAARSPTTADASPAVAEATWDRNVRSAGCSSPTAQG